MAVTKTKCLPHAPLLHWLCAESGCSDSQSSDRAMEHDWQTTEPHLKQWHLVSKQPRCPAYRQSIVDFLSGGYHSPVTRSRYGTRGFKSWHCRSHALGRPTRCNHALIPPLKHIPNFLRRPRPPTGRRSMSHICDGTVMRMSLPWFTSRFDREMNAANHALNQ